MESGNWWRVGEPLVNFCRNDFNGFVGSLLLTMLRLNGCWGLESEIGGLSFR